MLKTQWIKKRIAYTGEELRSLYAYLEHGVLGNSAIAFRGPCEVTPTHMVDGEDLLAGSKIAGSDMVHFIIEAFDQPLFAGVLLQRLLASLVIDSMEHLAHKSLDLRREGDDVYWGNRKASISIASRSPNSVMIHFAVNVSRKGTPVATCSLEDFGISPQLFAKDVLRRLSQEWTTVIEATQKVRAVP